MPKSILAVLLSLMLALPLQALAQLSGIGSQGLGYLSPSEERRLGSAIVQELRGRGLIIDDVQSNEYLRALGGRIASQTDGGAAGYTFFMLREDQINAFALPGGFVGINSGLVLDTRDEAELAGVLAHEIAHVAQRHIVRGIEEAERLTLPLAAALIASILLARGNAQVGQAAITSTLAYGAQSRIRYTRAYEQEADRVGTRLVAAAGFDPAGMTSFLSRLERFSGVASTLPEYLRTHPKPASRAADTLDRAPPAARDTLPWDPMAYALAKARLLVLTSPNMGQLLRRLEARMSAPEPDQATRYAYVLALKKAGLLDAARAQALRLRERDPDRLAYRIEEAEIAIARGEDERGWRLFEEARELYGDDFTLALHHGQALAIQGDPRRARRVLRPLLQRRPDNIELHALYAQASQRAGDLPETHAALAEYHHLSGDLELAIEQVELALRRPDATPYQQARLRARLRELKEEAEREAER